MKIIKDKLNILLFGAVLIFIITCTLHVFNEKKAAQAQGGSVGGRIMQVIKTPEPEPAGTCTPPGTPCACSATYTTTIQPAGGACAILCPPTANTPITGVPISPASVGYQILGFWPTCIGTAISTNWGTGL